MPTTSGTIKTKSSATGFTLVVVSASPPPPEVEFIDPPGWVKDAVIGNAGRPVDVIHDGGTPPAISAVVVK